MALKQVAILLLAASCGLAAANRRDKFDLYGKFRGRKHFERREKHWEEKNGGTQTPVIGIVT